VYERFSEREEFKFIHRLKQTICLTGHPLEIVWFT